MSERNISVLLVEDSPADARLVRETLAQSPGNCFRLECVDRLSTCVNRLAGGAIDVVLLDLALPDSYGLETFTRVRAGLPAAPVVVLSGAADEQLAMAAVQAGAQDYLMKDDAGYQALARSLCYAIERKRAQEQIHRLNAELEKRVLERTEQLKVANRELESFVCRASQDLSAIDGLAQRVLDEYAPLVPAEAQRQLQGIRDQAVHLEKLMEGLLTVSRIGKES